MDGERSSHRKEKKGLQNFGINTERKEEYIGMNKR
jgi:hypothetical protein